MYRVGFIDDKDSNVVRYTRRLRKNDIELVYLNKSLNSKEILNWVINEKVECLLIDYQLSPKYEFRGSSLINFLNKRIFDFPCMLLTSYAEDALEESLVPKSYIFQKKDMQEGIGEIAEIIKQAVEVFRSRMLREESEYRKKFERYQNKGLEDNELEDLKSQYNILRGYHIIENYDWEFVTKEKENELDNVIQKLDDLIERFDSIQGENG